MKRKALDVQRMIYDTITKEKKITLSELERKIRTNPRSLKEHCEALAAFGLIKIERSEKTTILRA